MLYHIHRGQTITMRVNLYTRIPLPTATTMTATTTTTKKNNRTSENCENSGRDFDQQFDCIQSEGFSKETRDCFAHSYKS